MIVSTASRWRTSSRRTPGRNSISASGLVRMRVWRPVSRFSTTVMSANSSPCWNVRATPSRAISCGARPEIVVAAKADRALAAIDAADAVEHAGLAGAVRADQREQLAALDAQATRRRAPAGRRSAASDASTSSSAIPPPGAAILLHVAIAAPFRAAGLAEIELLDVAVAGAAVAPSPSSTTRPFSST